MSERETWASRVGFILAAVGSAVGLGNIWRFPYVAADNGGAAFLVVYLIAAIGIGFPAMLAEFVVGRSTKRNVIDAFRNFGGRWTILIGILGLFTGFWILSYYSVVGGWVLQYIIGSVTGAYFGDPGAYFGQISTGTSALVFHALFMALAVGIVAFGIKRGIELATKVMVPAIVIMMLGIAVWASTLPGAAAGYDYFLSPDFGVLMSNLDTVVPFAVGQAFFSLSLGMGAMVTYASYLDGDTNLATDGLSIVILNTFVGVLAGLVVFPMLFALGIKPGESGASAIFVTIAQAFAQLPAGRVLGVVFFGLVAIAALSSAISLLEVVVSWVLDNFDVSRPTVSTAIGFVIFLLGIPSALNTTTLGQFDKIASNILLPTGVALTVVAVGWVYGRNAVREVRKGVSDSTSLPDVWLWHVRVVVFVAVVFTLVLSIAKFVGVSLF